MPRFPKLLSCLVLAAVSCTPRTPLGNGALSEARELRARLATVAGQFTEAGDSGFGFVPASPADRALIDSTVALDTAVVPLLVDCLADSADSRAVYHGAIFETLITPPIRYRDIPASRGAVCFWVFIRTAWFQRQIREHRADPDFFKDKGVSYHRIDGAAQLRVRDAWRSYLATRQLPHAWPVP